MTMAPMQCPKCGELCDLDFGRQCSQCDRDADVVGTADSDVASLRSEPWCGMCGKRIPDNGDSECGTCRAWWQQNNPDHV